MEDKKILFIDDEGFFKKLYKRKLEEEGAQVFLAEDSKEAYSVIEDEDLDLIITEITLSGKGGFSFIEEIREREGEEVPVIVHTELTRDGDRKDGHDLGIEGYFVKSEASISDVMDRVKSVLSEE